MGRLVLVLVLLAAGGTGGAYIYLQSQDDDELSGAEQEYAEAIAEANDAEEDNQLTHEENVCIGTAWVTTLGLRAFQDKVTPDEIRDNPANDHVDWGIDVSQEQAEALYDETDQCVDIPRWVAEGVPLDFEYADDQTVDCLAGSYDEHAMRAVVVASLIAGEDSPIEPTHADTFVGWLGGCIDLRADYIASLTEDGDLPDEILECLEQNLTTEAVETMMAESMAATEGTEPRDLPSADLVFGVLADCAEEAETEA